MNDNKLEEFIITVEEFVIIVIALMSAVLISWAFVEALIYFFSHIYIGWK